MADLISGVASNALQHLGSLALKEIASAWNFKSDLLRLTNTIQTIRDVLLAHEDGRLHGLESLIERLKDAVYDADDLLDKFTTLVERKRLMMSSSHGRFTKEVRAFFSRDNQAGTAFTISREIKRIRKTLDDIVGDREQFGSMLPLREADEPSHVLKAGRETCSFIDTEDVIGRDDDKKKILDVLLRHDNHDDLRKPHTEVVAVVGVGGLGKTTLAQFAFNNEDVQSHFQLMSWVCIGDDVIAKDIIRKIIGSPTNSLSLEQIHIKFREKMGGKKYLLVLDDVWEEDPNELLRLRSLLSVGEKGSRVLVTTRSTFTAQRIGTLPPLDLQLLSEGDSWMLFAKVAFEEGQEKDRCLVQIGKEIAKKCGNLPLAIKVIGSLLRGKDEIEWRYFKNHDLAKIESSAGIMPLLKLSYSRLRPQLKYCFMYCSLFPKDTEIFKSKLCQCWIAQGFITSSSQHPKESLEDVANQCFMELLHRSLFQDIRRTDTGEIMSFKMHDLVHDLSQEVAGKDILNVDGGGNQIGFVTTGVRHLSIGKGYSIPNLPSLLNGGGNRLRTFIWEGEDGTPNQQWKVRDLIPIFHYIKVLDLKDSNINELPNSIGQLIHLRYLDLSWNDFEMLPKSFTRLYNLETLNLQVCAELKELPCDISKLVNLQNLDIRLCDRIAYMPLGMGNMTCLQRLSNFVVGLDESAANNHNFTHCYSKPHFVNASGISDLFLLKNLRGSLNIVIDRRVICNGMSIIRNNACSLADIKDLTELKITLSGNKEEGDESQEEELLEILQPPCNIKTLMLDGYWGQKFPCWMLKNNLRVLLPNLVSIYLTSCERCQHLSILSQLSSLERVSLSYLRNVEYMESNYSYEASTSVSFFPSLKFLSLNGLSNVKGWWAPMAKHGAQPLPPPPCFPRLSELHILDCPNLTSMPLCPCIEDLRLYNFNENLYVTMMETEEEWNSTAAHLSNSPPPSSSSSTTILSTSATSQLKSLYTDSGSYLNHLSKSCFHNLTQLDIGERARVTHFPDCILQHLTALEDLRLVNCYVQGWQEVVDDTSWRSLRRLRKLEIAEFQSLITLPKWLKYLTNLQDLSIRCCNNLVELPEWISQLSSSLQSLFIVECTKLKALSEGMRDLTSLRYLELIGSDALTERCRKPTGADWPKIKHVPAICLPDGERVYQH